MSFHKYHFRKITNTDVQTVLTINSANATYLLNKIRKANGKTTDDDVRMWEFCAHEKVDIDQVCQVLKLKK